jgi:AAA ATPase-like protein
VGELQLRSLRRLPMLTGGHEGAISASVGKNRTWSSEMRLSWPLIGRTEETAALEAAILASDASGIVVYGAAGVGKSRIAREALSTAESHGFECRWAAGTSSARAIPLGAFTAWAPSGVTTTVQLLRGVIESLTDASSGATVVVCVDDVHLLDDLSTLWPVSHGRSEASCGAHCTQRPLPRVPVWGPRAPSGHRTSAT